MGLVSGTQIKYDQVGLREQLSDAIYRISPEDTPFMSSCARGTAKGTLVEWQTDSLAAADGTNAQLEGDDASFTTPASTVRVGNYTQISRKTAIVSGSLEDYDKAGRKSQMAFEIAKRSAELKRDQETIFLQAQAGNAGAVGTARTLAAMNAWIKTNDYVSTSGGSPTYTSGVPSAVRTDGTQVALTETIAKGIMQLVWASGGNPKVLMVGPYNKSVVSTFAGVVTQNFNMTTAKATAIISSADVWVTDFGTVRVIPNRFQRERDAWLLDWDLLEIDYFRPYKVIPLAKTGDAEKKMIICEYTLKVKQEAGLGLIADLTTSA